MGEDIETYACILTVLFKGVLLVLLVAGQLQMVHVVLYRVGRRLSLRGTDRLWIFACPVVRIRAVLLLL